MRDDGGGGCERALMGACILYPCRISLPGLPALRVEREITGGDCSCPRVNKNNTHTGPSPASAHAKIFFANIYIWASGDCKTRGRGRRRWELKKKMCRSRHPRPLGRRFPAQQLDYADCLATSFSPAALRVLSAGLPFFTCLRLRRWLRPAATASACVCIYWK